MECDYSDDFDSYNDCDANSETLTVSDCNEESDNETFLDSPRKARTTSPSLFKNQVLNVLNEIADSVPRKFSVSGVIDSAPLVVISVKSSSNGIMKFPLYKHEVSKIISYFIISPFGRGVETLVDTTVKNSWQLHPSQFMILNPNWDLFVNEMLVPRIAVEMGIEYPFVATLYKLQLYTSGSFFRPHRDSEKVNGMFATLVVQMPSHYKGGELIVRHDGKTETMHFTRDPFATYFAAFYSDCEHEICPVTDGFLVFLIYNLISQSVETVPSVPHKSSAEKLSTLIDQWTIPRKLVYVFKHKYSESSLSYKNLKTSDKEVALIVKSFAVSHNLMVFLALFKNEMEEEGHSDSCSCSNCSGCLYLDASNEDITRTHSYSSQRIVFVSGSEDIPISAMNVDFKEEVIPDNYIDFIDPYKDTCLPTDNEGTHVSKCYRSAAIVFWPKKLTFQVLKNGNAPFKLIQNMFLHEMENHFNGQNNDIAESRLTWAETVLSSHSQVDPIRLINVIVKFNDIALIQDMFLNAIAFNEQTIPLFIVQCEKYGWDSFSAAIVKAFNKAPHEKALAYLNLLLGDGYLKDDQKEACRIAFQIILNHSQTIGYHTSDDNSTREEVKEQDYLYAACLIAEKIDFDIMELARTKPFTTFVPVLARLVPKSQKLKPFWSKVAKHFIEEMKISELLIESTSWGQYVDTTCQCADCFALNAFLRSDRISVKFKIAAKRRQHLQQRINYMENIAHSTDAGSRGRAGVLNITKIEKSAELKRLQSIMADICLP